jgi:hypothetical protein
MSREIAADWRFGSEDGFEVYAECDCGDRIECEPMGFGEQVVTCCCGREWTLEIQFRLTGGDP